MEYPDDQDRAHIQYLEAKVLELEKSNKRMRYFLTDLAGSRRGVPRRIVNQAIKTLKKAYPDEENAD